MSAELSAPRLMHFAREAGKNMRAAPVLTVVAVLTIAVSLLLVGLFGIVLTSASTLLDGISHDLRITAYLDPGANAAAIDTLQAKIAEREEVASVRYLTAEEDRALSAELLGPELLEGLDEAAIPGQHAIAIQLEPRRRDKADFERVRLWLDELAAVEVVEDLWFGADKIRILFALVDLLRVAGLIISVIVLAAAIFFTFSTIKLAVYARREEIEILRLVGATPRFIQAPFYIEGAAAGLMGSAVAIAIIGYLHSELVAFAEEEHLLNLDLDLMPAGMMLWLLCGGITLGWLGSVLSVGRYLRT